MKVSAQPFEPPLATPDEDAGDRARLERAQHLNDGVAPIASVQTELNPATRESLSKLAQAIRSQLSAADAANEEANEQSKERESDRPQLSLVESEEAILQDSVDQKAFSQVARAGAVLRAADRKRGQSLYSQQNTKTIFELVSSELIDRAKTKPKTAA